MLKSGLPTSVADPLAFKYQRVDAVYFSVAMRRVFAR
jgi:hypothetical protein